MTLRDATNQIWPTTHWSLVGQAGHGAEAEKAKALAALIKQYLPVLRKHLRIFRQINPFEVDDILQDFVLLKFLEKEIVQSADKDRGRFRNFLIVCVDRFLQNRMRDQTRLKRQAGKLVSLDGVPDLTEGSAPPGDSFEVDWSRQVIGRAIRRMRFECGKGKRPEVWAVFRGRMLMPYLKAAVAVPYAELVKRYHFSSPAQASNILITANRMFARALHSVIAAYEKEDHDIEQEILDLWHAVSLRRAGRP